MDPFYKSYAQNDLVSLHYVTFIEPHVIIPMESLSFGLDHFMNKSINELIEGKIKDPFLLLEDNLFTAALLYNKTYKVQIDDLSHEVLEYFLEL
jgi:hypothetical protein